MSKKKYSFLFLFSFFLGTTGLHRFYVRKYLTGLLMLLTLGGLGFWYMFDLCTIVLGIFKDKEGLSIRPKKFSFFKKDKLVKQIN